jgi:hypothetical protein
VQEPFAVAPRDTLQPAQAALVPPQLELQQKPSTQNPDAHSQLPPHDAPCAFLATHEPPTQMLVDSQLVFPQTEPEQLVAQAPPVVHA